MAEVFALKCKSIVLKSKKQNLTLPYMWIRDVNVKVKTLPLVIVIHMSLSCVCDTEVALFSQQYNKVSWILI